jgi:hypothetical protein
MTWVDGPTMRQTGLLPNRSAMEVLLRFDSINDMPNALLAWELGGGSGHIRLLQQIARELEGIGLRPVFALKRPDLDLYGPLRAVGRFDENRYKLPAVGSEPAGWKSFVRRLM